MMNIDTLEHKHGGKILSLDAIRHETYKGRASWEFIGRVEWHDGSVSPEASIPPTVICCEDAPNNFELTVALAALNGYLVAHGDWTERNGWIPREKNGTQPL